MYQDHSRKLCRCDSIACKKSTAMDFKNSDNVENPSDVKERLQKMELLAQKLKIQLYFCAFAVILTVAVYFLFWYFSECWVLPFQESPCMQPRVLPLISTDQSTLADAVDEFTFALQTQINKFHAIVEMTFIAERQLQFTLTKKKIDQLLYQHSADLAGFGALKREDERLEDVDKASTSTYVFLTINFVLASTIFFLIMGFAVTNCQHPGTEENTSTEEMKNSQNDRLKKLKRLIPFLHIATFVCIAAGLVLYFMLFAGLYYSTPDSYYSNNNCKATNSWQGKNMVVKDSFSDYHSFLMKLNSTLQKSCVGIKNSFSSPVLELRQSVWHYESEALAIASKHHLRLKQYCVDRRTMPRKIGNVYQPSLFYLLFLVILFSYPLILFHPWAKAEGSVWQVFHNCF